MFKIEFDTRNAAFYDETATMKEYHDYVKAEEAIRILNNVIQMLNSGYRKGTCVDYNGNRVGSWKLD